MPRNLYSQECSFDIKVKKNWLFELKAEMDLKCFTKKYFVLGYRSKDVYRAVMNPNKIMIMSCVA